MRKNQELKSNPDLIYFITNEYCRGHSCDYISKKIYDIFNIKIHRNTLRYWIKKYRNVIDLDSIREKEFVNFQSASRIAFVLSNLKIKHRETSGMKNRILKIGKIN